MTRCFANSSACSTANETGGTRSLEATVSEAGFADRAVAVVRRVSSAPDVADVYGIMVDATRVFGAQQSVFASYIRDDDSRESFRLLVAGDPGWCVDYRRLGWYADDAWLLHAARSSEPVPDSKIEYRTSREREFRDLAAARGVRSAYLVPAPASPGVTRLGVLMLGSSRAGYFEGAGEDVLKVFARSLAMELHEWWVSRIRDEIVESTGVTQLDLTLLRLERAGKLTKQIAAELGISEASINNRFQRLNAKFKTPNRKATARLAAEYGLL